MKLPWQETVKLFNDLNKKLKDAGYEPNLEIRPQDNNPDKWYVRLWTREKDDDKI